MCRDLARRGIETLTFSEPWLGIHNVAGHEARVARRDPTSIGGRHLTSLRIDQNDGAVVADEPRRPNHPPTANQNGDAGVSIRADDLVLGWVYAVDRRARLGWRPTPDPGDCHATDSRPTVDVRDDRAVSRIDTQDLSGPWTVTQTEPKPACTSQPWPPMSIASRPSTSRVDHDKAVVAQGSDPELAVRDRDATRLATNVNVCATYSSLRRCAQLSRRPVP